MSVALALPVFVVGAAVSLGASWILVSRLERVGERLGFSEALLGIVAALAADAPEITSAVTALAHHEHRTGTGVILGSNLFNLATLLGLGALLAGGIALHRKSILLGGVVAMWVAVVSLAAVLGALSPLACLVLALVVLFPYVAVLAAGVAGLARLRLPRGWSAWLGSAIAEEELELEAAIRPRMGRRQDAFAAAASVLVVVGASVAMERAASSLGRRYAVPDIVIGGLVLAAVTGLPNAVTGIYLATRGRGAAAMSTALNSNTLNITVGLLIPAVVVGIGQASGQTALLAAWYIGMSAFVLALSYRDRGIRRGTGMLIICGYLVFVGSLLASAHAG
ncbi:MAG: sodium:calcium antiporter, partial [Acidimicrobiales bacterium]